MLPVVQIGPAAIQLEGLILLAGLWIGLMLGEKYSNKHGIPSAGLYNLVFLMMIGGLLGARLSYILMYPQIFLQDPVSMVSLSTGLLDASGGLLVALLAGLVYARRKKFPVLAVLDALTPLFAVLLVAMPLANLASGKAYGREADIPWKIFLWGTYRHPVQIYEMLSAIFILIYTWPGRWRYEQKNPGEYFFLFASFSAASRLILEFFRGESALLPGGVRTAQVIAWGILVACIWIYDRVRRPRAEKGVIG